MLDKRGKTLYVGKAKNLRKRVSSYFKTQVSLKTQQLIAQTLRVSITVTETEREALFIENNLIKSLQPKYNVLFRDDKSYPYLVLSNGMYPRLSIYRCKQKPQGRCFGPFLSMAQVKKVVELLQKSYKLRSCDDTSLRTRIRPCLQYQIKRCSAPCIQALTAEAYQENVRQVEQILVGEVTSLERDITMNMQRAADHQAYEQAAQYRDQLVCLRSIQQEHQYLLKQYDNIEVIGCAIFGHFACLHKLVIHDNTVANSQQYYHSLTHCLSKTESELVATFITQHYLEAQQVPKELLSGVTLPDAESCVFAEQGLQVKQIDNLRGQRKQWALLAMRSATEALKIYTHKSEYYLPGLLSLQQHCHLSQLPELIHCFDISHFGGQQTLAACVVFTKSGADKSQYRRYNIKLAAAADDYGAMYEALLRHYQKMVEQEQPLPDILLIDGGRGQLAKAQSVFDELQQYVYMIAIAKGAARRAGQEKLFVGKPATLLEIPTHDPGFRLLQRVRDEAHRFAITGNRQKRAKILKTSLLEQIPGIGPNKRRLLLTHFGGLQEIKKASIQQLQMVPGINHSLAERIYTFLQLLKSQT